MKAVLVALTAFAAASMAQDPNCGANYIVEACLDSEGKKLAACSSQDYDCQCNGHINVVTCFNNCPNDDRKPTWEGQQQIFCGYATQFASTTKAAVPTKSGASTPAQTTGAKQDDGSNDDSTPTDKDAATGTGTGTAAGATNTGNGAADVALNAGSMLAAVAAVAAVVL